MDQIRPVSYQELSSLVKSSNSKTSGLDSCPTDLLKRTFDSHSQTLLTLFNKSFVEGTFPTAFKVAQVTPLLKSPSMDAHMFKSYRPISNLPTIGKLLERIGIMRLNEHLEKLKSISQLIKRDTLQKLPCSRYLMTSLWN